jgi:hypothetical protein
VTDKSELENALDQSIVALTGKATEAPQAGTALKYALAVQALAEARAWISTPAQPHGSISYTEG